MKYIEKLKQIINKKMVFVATGALAACLVVAAMVFFGLQMIAPKKSQPLSTETNKTATSGKNQADTLFKTGDEALQAGDAEKGIAALKQAQKLYEQAGDTMKVEEIKDQIALAEHALKVQSEYKSTEIPKDQGKTAKSS